MLLISHRGNLYGPNTANENNPDYIQRALDLHFPVEVDLWCDIKGKLFLGHDRPDYKVPLSWLWERRGNLWIHCKNSEAFVYMAKDYSLGFNYFFHRNDPYTLTSQGYPWCHPTVNIAPNRGISVMPETMIAKDQILELRKHFYGICSDYVGELDKELE